MKYIVFLLFFTLILEGHCRTSIPSFPFTSAIPSTSNGEEYQFDLSGLGIPVPSDINIQFQILNTTLKSSTFVMISYEDKYKAGDINRFDFYGKSSKDFQGIMDLNGMQLFRKQYINIKRVSGNNTLYFTIYNLDPSSRRVTVSFTITLQYQIGPNCYSCNGGTRESGGCICKNCPFGYYGQDCSINMLTLTKGSTTTLTLNGPAMAFFKLHESQQVNIIVKQSSGQGEAYFQFIQFQGQFASYTNVAVGRNIEGRFPVLGGSSGTTISATSSGTPMSITVAVYDPIMTNVEVYYLVQQSSNILVIVLGVLGGVLFIGLVIAACYIIRNANFGSQQTRQSRGIRPHVQTNLSDQEVQRFFPTIVMRNISSFGEQQGPTLQNINQKPKQQLNQDCVICLCPVQQSDQVKVTYCKHIFHSPCLTGWFKKQQNCPYCRQQFNRQNTIKLYKRLKQLNEKQVLKGQSLIKAIIKSKSHFLSNKQVNQKQPQQIQIASRNQVEVQDINS